MNADGGSSAVTLWGVAATPKRAERFPNETTGSARHTHRHTVVRQKAAVAAGGNTPVLHSVIPIRWLAGHSNGRHQYQLRHVLRVLQRVHGGQVAAHAAGASQPHHWHTHDAGAGQHL
jgi:hypothetical protein